MSRERHVAPWITEPLRFEEIASAPHYARSTDKPVQFVTVANPQGTVLGYVWANDEDDAAGWKVRRAGGDEAFNRGRAVRFQAPGRQGAGTESHGRSGRERS